MLGLKLTVPQKGNRENTLLDSGPQALVQKVKMADRKTCPVSSLKSVLYGAPWRKAFCAKLEDTGLFSKIHMVEGKS